MPDERTNSEDRAELEAEFCNSPWIKYIKAAKIEPDMVMTTKG